MAFFLFCACFLSSAQPGVFQSRSQSFVPLDQRSENESFGSIHFEITKEITEFCTSGFTAQCAFCIYGIYGACLKWLLPELSFSDRWSRGTKLWERDWVCSRLLLTCLAWTSIQNREIRSKEDAGLESKDVSRPSAFFVYVNIFPPRNLRKL